MYLAEYFLNVLQNLIPDFLRNNNQCNLINKYSAFKDKVIDWKKFIQSIENSLNKDDFESATKNKILQESK